jgi:hypothetical protein
MATTLMLTLGGALILLTSSETVIAANFRTAHEALYAADAGFDRALVDLRNISDWTTVLNGDLRSSFADGAPAGTRRLVDGSLVNLDEVANQANCQKAVGCSDAEIADVSAERPWGANNPRWRLFAFGALANSLDGTAVHSAFYLVVFVGDDPSENDGDPTVDGFSTEGVPNPGKGIAMVRAEAFGPRGAHKVIEATVERFERPPAAEGDPISTDLRVLSWREVR